MKRIIIFVFILLCFASYGFSATCDGTALSGLTEDTAPTSDDIIYTVDDPDGTQGSRKVTIENILKPNIQTTDPSDTDPSGIYVNTTDGDAFIVSQNVGVSTWATTYTPYVPAPPAEFTTTTSGNINDGATFGNASPGVAGTDFPRPAGADTIIVSSGDELTVPALYSVTTSGSTVDSTIGDHGKLIVNGTLTLDGNFVMNDYSELVLGAGSTVDLDGNDIVHSQGNGDIHWLSFNGTTGAHVTVKSTTPGGRITENAAGNATGIYLASTYTDFSDMGDSQFCKGSTLVALTTTNVANCTFTDHGDIDFTMGNYTTQEFTIANCDFREPSANGKQVNVSATATPTASEVRTFANNTFSTTQYYGDIDADAEGMTIDGLVRDGYIITIAEPDITIVNDFAYNAISSNATANSITAGASTEKLDYQDGYIYMVTDNAKPISTPAIIASVVEDNIFETTDTVNEGNIIILNTGNCSVQRNILFGEATLATSLGSARNATIRRNTVFATSIGTYGLLAGSESTGTFGATTNIYSNLIVDSDTTDNDYGVYLSVSTIDQITNTDYNNFYGVPGGDVNDHYFQVSITGKTEGVDVGFGLNDLNLNPSFTDSSRRISSWDTSLSGAGTAANAITEMLKLNQSGFNANYTQANLMSYTRTGLTPTNASLNGAGFGGDDIGAVDF